MTPKLRAIAQLFAFLILVICYSHEASAHASKGCLWTSGTAHTDDPDEDLGAAEGRPHRQNLTYKVRENCDQIGGELVTCEVLQARTPASFKVHGQISSGQTRYVEIWLSEDQGNDTGDVVYLTYINAGEEAFFKEQCLKDRWKSIKNRHATSWGGVLTLYFNLKFNDWQQTKSLETYD